MISSRSNKRPAALGFALVTAVVIGGMAWATSATLRLERVEQETRLAAEHKSRILLAINALDEFVYPHLAVETGRGYQDYVRFSPASDVYDPEFEQYPPGMVRQRSPIAEGSGCPWIELYFQVDPGPDEVRWSSPQISDLSSDLVSKLGVRYDDNYREAYLTMLRLQEALPLVDMIEGVERAYAQSQRSAVDHDPEPVPRTAPVQTVAARTGGAEWVDNAPEKQSAAAAHQLLQRRQQSRFEQGLSALAQSQMGCATTEQINANVRNTFWQTGGQIEFSSTTPNVDVIPLLFKPLWYKLEGGDDGLVFVRKVEAGAARFYQGFTVRWDRLRNELLKEIRAALPTADLVPVRDGDTPTEDRMATLPVRLEPNEVPVVPAAAVWEKVRLTLVTSWLAAIGVLAAAGIGFRNLVALTERRLQFAYAVTHELRTPLTTFQLYSDMLAAGLVPEDSRQEYFETLNKESKRLSDLVEGVLEYARLENQKVTLHPSITTAPGLMQIISDQISERCKRHGVVLRAENAVVNGLAVYTDVDLIKQVTGVLVNNACRHAGDSADPTVIVRLEADEDRLHLDVIDTGPGIDRADARLVFRPFRRGRNAEAKAQSGIGLGLALARGWAQLLGGRLELAARRHPVHGGAHFRLSIPLKSNAMPEPTNAN